MAKKKTMETEETTDRFDDLFDHIVFSIYDEQGVEGDDLYATNDISAIRDAIEAKRATGEFYSERELTEVDTIIDMLMYKQGRSAIGDIILKLTPSGVVHDADIGEISMIGTPYEDDDLYENDYYYCEKR